MEQKNKTETFVAYIGIPQNLDDIEGFEEIVFYAKRSDESFLRLGNDEKSHVGMDEINQMLQDGSIERIDNLPLNFDEKLWVTKSGAVYKGTFTNRSQEFVVKISTTTF